MKEEEGHTNFERRKEGEISQFHIPPPPKKKKKKEGGGEGGVEKHGERGRFFFDWKRQERGRDAHTQSHIHIQRVCTNLCLVHKLQQAEKRSEISRLEELGIESSFKSMGRFRMRTSRERIQLN